MPSSKDGSKTFDYKDEQVWTEFAGADAQPLKSSTLYRMRLTAKGPTGLVTSPKSSFPSRVRRGENILEGNWRFGSESLDVPAGRAPWGPPFPSLHFADRIHRFEWLRDVIATGEKGEKLSRSLVVSWVTAFGKWDDIAWRVDVSIDRVINWLIAAPYIINPLSQEIRTPILESLARQVQHISLSHEELKSLRARFRAGVCLCLAGLCLPDSDYYIETGLAIIEREIEVQLLKDGGHVTRSPTQLAEALIDLNIVEDLLLRMSREAPSFLSKAQMRMQNMLKFLRAPDGGTIVTNSGSDGWDGLVQAALSPFGEGGGRFAFAQQTGFHRIEANELTFYLDIGSSSAGDNTELANASCLAIHIFDGVQRLVTAMGAHPDLNPDWRFAARQTAASSTLELDHKNSADFFVNHESGLQCLRGPREVSARRLEEGDQFLLEAQHSGWRDTYSLVHRRRVYVAKDGDRITGEDAIYRPLSEFLPPLESEVPYSIRFYLHPSVRLQSTGSSKVLDLLPFDSDTIWRFKSESAVSVTPYVYTAGGARRRAACLEIRANANPSGDGSAFPNRIRWAFSRLSAKHSLSVDVESAVSGIVA